MRPWKQSDEFWRRLRGGHIPRVRKFLCKELVRTAVTCYDVYAIEQILANQVLESIKMGTTVATNALLERKGEPTAFVVTQGMKVRRTHNPF